jgi:hypothetical protein
MLCGKEHLPNHVSNLDFMSLPSATAFHNKKICAITNVVRGELGEDSATNWHDCHYSPQFWGLREERYQKKSRDFVQYTIQINSAFFISPVRMIDCIFRPAATNRISQAHNMLPRHRAMSHT